jgi:hypothetical protein
MKYRSGYRYPTPLSSMTRSILFTQKRFDSHSWPFGNDFDVADVVDDVEVHAVLEYRIQRSDNMPKKSDSLNGGRS